MAIYLFLAGMSAGAIFFAILLRYFCLGQRAWQSRFVRAACLIAPLAIWGGLGILLIDLTKPFDFWKILVFYNPISVMSLGVMVLMVYQVFMFAWLALVFRQPLQALTAEKWPWCGKALEWLRPYEATITGLTMILSLALGLGFWGWIFWGGIIGLGLSVPLAMNLFMTASAKRHFSYVAFTACMSLLGVLLLRNFILYTGQMTML
ncbi:MAG: polysulfide reductase NrfD [Shewanella sp.]|nr:polysulfide reductase NrfD [Shewanella sp.]MCF1457234.1 polysulfide reductase NrfD [Shewanella sp.]